MAIIANGMTMVILTGGIELSVGSVVALSSMVSAIFISKMGLSVGVSVIIGILVGALAGLTNGFIISYGNVPAFITTLGINGICTGAGSFSDRRKTYRRVAFEL